MCQSNLRCIYAVVSGPYGWDNDGAFPPSLDTLVANGYMGRSLLFCPGYGLAHMKNGMRVLSEPSDYTYLYWPTGRKTPGHYPLLYDGCRANHEVGGVNVLRVDGNVLWDTDGNWLREFKSESGLPIPLPKE